MDSKVFMDLIDLQTIFSYFSYLVLRRSIEAITTCDKLDQSALNRIIEQRYYQADLFVCRTQTQFSRFQGCELIYWVDLLTFTYQHRLTDSRLRTAMMLKSRSVTIQCTLQKIQQNNQAMNRCMLYLNGVILIIIEN